MATGIIGRDRELEAVAEFLSDCAHGPAALLVTGEPGIGKTALLQQAVERAQASGRRVLVARPGEGDAALAFAALTDLLHPVVDEFLPTLPAPQRHALAVALLREEPRDEHLDQRAVASATASVLRRAAARTPVVVAVDDVQWLDAPSAHVLEFALRRVTDLPLGWLVARRIEPGLPRTTGFEAVLPPDATRRVDLASLSVAALQHLLKERLGRPFTRRMLVRIEAATGGNPLFALEIARSLPEDASVPLATLPLPDRLLELIESRIRSLSPRGRALLLVAAALRVPTIEQLRAATGDTEVEWSDALEEVEGNGIVELEGTRLHFVHPLFAAAVYASAPAADRRRVHRKLATLAGALEERARHAALGADGPDAEIAAVLEHAAEHARGRGAPEGAAELAEWARALTPETQAADRRRRTVQVAEYRFHAGEVRAARDLLSAVLDEAPAGRARADALRLLGEIRYHQDSFPEAVVLFEEALGLVGDDVRLASGIELRLALCLRALGRFAEAEVHTLRALELTERLGDSALQAEALAVKVRLDVLLGRGLDEASLDRALELEDPYRQVAMQLRPSKVAGDLLLYVGELERSVRLLRRERERVLERGEESDLPFVLSHLTWAECWQGRLMAAAANAQESLEIAVRLGSPSVRSMALALAAIVAAHRGDAAATRVWAHEALELARETGWHTAMVWGSWALGLLAISLEDPRGADDALGALTRAVEAEGLAEPVRAMFLAEHCEALIALGELERAARLIDLFEGAAVRVGRRWALLQAGRCRALMLAVKGDIDAAAEAARAAVDLTEGVELRLEVARTLLVAGQIERRRRRKAAARDLVGRALAIFEDCGASVWASRARAELERIGGAPSPGSALTASERRVAGLAATGLTNREVAAQLFMSAKTVEAHLASAYRKLGIRSRAQLGARLGVGPAGAKN